VHWTQFLGNLSVHEAGFLGSQDGTLVPKEATLNRPGAAATLAEAFSRGVQCTGDFTMIGDVDLAPWAIVLVDSWMWTPYVMLICLAGLRSIPDYIYEAAEVDRASPWRQFCSITLPMVLPFLSAGPSHVMH